MRAALHELKGYEDGLAKQFGKTVTCRARVWCLALGVSFESFMQTRTTQRYQSKPAIAMLLRLFGSPRTGCRQIQPETLRRAAGLLRRIAKHTNLYSAEQLLTWFQSNQIQNAEQLGQHVGPRPSKRNPPPNPNLV